MAIGPLVGGFLTEALSWRWLFFVNIPVASLAVFLTIVAVRESRDETAGRRLDLMALATVTLGLTALVVGIQQGDTLGWGSPFVITVLVAATVLLGLFFVYEPRVRNPLIDLGLFANRSYLGANAVAFAQNFGFGALVFFLPLYLQNVLGYSPLQSGVVLLPFTVTLVICDALAGRVAVATGIRLPMTIGMALSTVAFLLLALVTPSGRLTFLLATLAIAGVGQALAYTVSTTGGMAAIPQEKAG